MTAAVHPFERAGLGRAPFRCTGWYESKYQACHGAPIQPGSSCDYCSQGIMLVYVIKSADGKQFKVGCDCVAKVARACAKTDFEREARRMVDAVNKIKTAASNARKDERITAALAKLEANRDRLAEMRIFDGYRERQALERLEWMFKNAGRAGKIKAAKQLDELLGGAA